MTRAALLSILYRRTQTVRYVGDKVSLLEALARPVGYSVGSPVEVDGDALTNIRKAVAS